MKSPLCILLFSLVIGLSTQKKSVPVAFSKSEDYGHHVTIEDQGDYYLVRVNVTADVPPELFDKSLKQLEVALLTDQGFDKKQRVPLKTPTETWGFYFKAPKYATLPDVKYGLIARTLGVPNAVSVVWEVEDNEVNLGTKQEPLVLEQQIKIPVRQEIAPGQFSIKELSEIRAARNDYDALPIVQMSSPEKPLPRSLAEKDMARQLTPK